MMTMEPTTETTEVETPAPVVFETMLEIVRQIAGLSAVVSKDRPILAGIYVHEVDGALVAVATDSYVLARLQFQVVDLPKGLELLIDAAALVSFVKAVGARTPGIIPVVWTVEEGAVTLAAFGTSQRIRLIDGAFPKYQNLIPEPGSGELASGTVALNPDKIKALDASIPKRDKGRVPMRFEFHNEKPIAVSVPSLNWDGLIMPVRV